MISVFKDAYFFDIDNTLITHGEDGNAITRHYGFEDLSITITCPILKDTFPAIPNLNLIRLLREKAARGYYIVAWSKQGGEYVEAVIQALGLEREVHLCIGKPTGIVDDLPAEAWMPKNVWIDPKARYKR